MESTNMDRYSQMTYNRCGRSGLLLPQLSLGCWHNFGADTDLAQVRELLCYAFDRGITHFDLANNYGPPPGSAETQVGRVLKTDLANHRDELIISTKAGYWMHPGPYGEWGSKKYLVSSLDASLKRLQLDYVDIFYSHRFDPHTPLEETLEAIAQVIRQGKALYAAISNYSAEHTQRAAEYFKEARIPFILNQVPYSLFNRGAENGLFETADTHGIGIITFSSLAQGLLTNRYLNGIPKDSRAASESPFLTEQQLTPKLLAEISRLNAFAEKRGQSLARLALQWAARHPTVTSLIIGASQTSQLEENLKILQDPPLSDNDLAEIETLLDG